MNLTFSPRAWYEYTEWQLEDKKILKRINLLIKDIERNGNTESPATAEARHCQWQKKS